MHLMLGTRTDNAKDMAQKGRSYFKKGEPQSRGEDATRAKLTIATVDRIRAERSETGMTYAFLAKKHGISCGHVRDVITGKFWGRNIHGNPSRSSSIRLRITKGFATAANRKASADV
jgi:ribosome-binding protein aMBF1 (putative translation factor)